MNIITPPLSFPLLAPNGALATPSYAFANFPNTGWLCITGSGPQVELSVAGVFMLAMDGTGGGNGILQWNGNFLRFGAGGNTSYLECPATNVIAVKNGDVAQALRVYGSTTGAHYIEISNPGFGKNQINCGNAADPIAYPFGAANGQDITYASQTELLTIAAAASTDTAFTIPINAVVLGVSVRVTTVIPTAATFTVTAATGGTTFNTAAVSTAANTTDPGTAAGASFRSAATKVRITPNVTPGAATGVVRVTAYYYTVTPPTS